MKQRKYQLCGKRINGKEIYLGTFNDVQSAFMEYKKHKEAYIREIAEIYKSTISKKAYYALISYQVDIND